MIWNRLSRPEFGISNSISDSIATLEWANPNLLTDLRCDTDLIVICDYSGQHNEASHESYSFLVAAKSFTWLWDELRKETRKKILRDGRRMSFKALNDSRRKQALVSLLKAANTIPGLLFTIIVDKRIGSLFKKDAGSTIEPSNLVNWHPDTLERLLRMSHFGSTLLSGLSAPGQNVIWLTDEDDIVANSQRIIDGTEAIVNITSHYMPHNLGHFRYGSTQSDDGSFFIEDIASIPDLAAGALNEIACKGLMPRGQGLTIPLSTELSKKSRCIAGWIADGELHTLKRIVMALDAGEKGSIWTRVITLRVEEPIREYMWHEDFHRIVRD